MVKVILAKNYQDYAEAKGVEVELPSMPNIGDTILLKDESHEKLKGNDDVNFDNDVNCYKAVSIVLCEEFDYPCVIVGLA